ncbi:MAG: hypothetical protein IJV22_07090 [Bacteroidales bacterium]|nr:hypothetical protein [Bacteroidales bacterium]
MKYRTVRLVMAVCAVLVLGLTSTSCKSSTNHLIDRYEKAIEQHDYEAASKILDKLEDRRLTDEQTARIANINTHGGLDFLHHLGNSYLQGLGEIFTEERVDKMKRASDKAMSEMRSELDEALKEFDEELVEYLDE